MPQGKTHTDKTRSDQSKSVAQKQSGKEPDAHWSDNRPETPAQRMLREANAHSPGGSHPSTTQLKDTEEEESLQKKATPGSEQEASAELKENKTGMPDNLKAGVENLSGHTMDDVKVHYNSDKPAQLDAYAYAQGTDIHIGPGQEKHLPHEAWHVVQQKEGRVQPTKQIKGDVNVNDDKGLEKEADVMGQKSLESSHGSGKKTQLASKNRNVLQLEGKEGASESNELLDLANELEKSKSEESSVSSGEIDKAIQTLKDAAENADGDSLAVGVKKLKGNIEKLEKEPSPASEEKETAQLSGWRFALGGLGLILGSVVPIIGTIFGAYLGYRRGRVMDWKNKAAPAAFTPANIVFCSMSGGNVGSIYFNAGRIRLTHGSGPSVSTHAGIQRFTISNADYLLYKAWKPGRTFVQKYHYVTGLGSCVPAVAGAGERLFEFFGVNGAAGNHPSRGGPVAFGYVLNQAQVNLLYHAANHGDNDVLRHAMSTDTVLSTIPIN